MKSTAFYILLGLVLLSLALNAVLLLGLNSARLAVVDALDTSLSDMSSLENARIETTFHVQQTVPVRMDVPFKRDLTVPIKLSVPVQQRIPFHDNLTIPVKTLVGEYNVNVPVSVTIPIDMDIPIDTQVPIALSETIPISDNIPLDVEVPVSIPLSDTGLSKYLADLRATLTTIRDRLSFGR